MEKQQTSSSSAYCVSRSRGKSSAETLYQAKLRAARKAKGQSRSSDESESEEDMEPGATVLHKMFNRKVVLQPDGIVVKSGKRIAIGEADALTVAAAAGIPVPRVHHVREIPVAQICMDYIQGQTLEALWPTMSAEQKEDIARQLRDIVQRMRSVAPPTGLIGACDGTEIRDTRVYFTYHSPPCSGEAAFNEYLLSALYDQTPQLLREAFSRRLRTDHRIVLSHCDLCPRNIMVREGKIVAILDWEDSGWYPEYWEYVKFFQRNTDNDWKQHAHLIFPELYHDELVDFVALSKWQKS